MKLTSHTWNSCCTGLILTISHVRLHSNKTICGYNLETHVSLVITKFNVSWAKFDQNLCEGFMTILPYVWFWLMHDFMIEIAITIKLRKFLHCNGATKKFSLVCLEMKQSKTVTSQWISSWIASQRGYKNKGSTINFLTWKIF